jgi:hypothetical protein
MATLLTGGCACGAIRYECSGEPTFAANCYCRDCQRSSGTAFSSGLFVPKEALNILQGEVRYFEVTAESGKQISRGFCPTCGSPVFTLAEAMPSGVGIKASSLDDPNQFRPAMNLFMSSAPVWSPVAEALPKFPKMPG